MSTIWEAGQCSRRHISARTYVGEFIIAFLIIREDSECFSHNLKCRQRIIQEMESRGLLAHLRRFRLVGEREVGLVQVGIFPESRELLVFDTQDARGLEI
jgi:hypothetical protein